MSLVRRAVLAYSVRNRTRKAQLITAVVGARIPRLLLCGAVGTSAHGNEGVVERHLAASADRVFAFNLLPPPEPQPWPVVMADALRMPFAVKSFDLAVSNALIEHVGGEQEQRALISEHSRVAAAWVITTPNRWFPVESHSATIVRHWSARWRRNIPSEVFTRLLSRREFAAMMPAGTRVFGHWWSPTFTAIWSGPDRRGSASYEVTR